jgi:alpha-1,2-mannosyltransferase
MEGTDVMAPNAQSQAPADAGQHVLGRLIASTSSAAQALRVLAAGGAVILGLAALRLSLASLLPELVFRKDFLQDYVLAKAIAERANPYVPISVLAQRYLGPLPQAVFPHPSPHPPPLGVLFLPLIVLDYSTAALLWLVFELGCLVAAVYMLGRAVGVRLPILRTLALTAALLVWYPFSFGLVFGQLMIPMLCLLAGARLAMRSGRDGSGGVLIGLALLLKPIAWPLLLMLALLRRWRALAASAVSVLVGYVIALPLVGVDVFLDYFTRVVPLVSNAYRSDPWNFSLASLGWKLFEGTGSKVTIGLEAPPLVESVSAARAASFFAPVFAVLLAAAVVRRAADIDISLGVMLGVSILIAPITWSHYLVLASIPAAYVVAWLVERRFPHTETNVALVVTMLLVVEWGAVVDRVSGARSATNGVVMVPFALAIASQMPALALGALTSLVAWLGLAEH